MKNLILTLIVMTFGQNLLATQIDSVTLHQLISGFDKQAAQNLSPKVRNFTFKNLNIDNGILNLKIGEQIITISADPKTNGFLLVNGKSISLETVKNKRHLRKRLIQILKSKKTSTVSSVILSLILPKAYAAKDFLAELNLGPSLQALMPLLNQLTQIRKDFCSKNDCRARNRNYTNNYQNNYYAQRNLNAQQNLNNNLMLLTKILSNMNKVNFAPRRQTPRVKPVEYKNLCPTCGPPPIVFQ